MKATLFKTTLVFLLAVALTSCGNQGEDDALKEVKINPAFEMRPPIAEDVLVNKIDGDEKNLLLTARFSKKQLPNPFLAINQEGNKIVLRDDGKGDDKVANDGLFTIKVPADVKAFENTAERNSKMMLSSPHFTFVGRSIISQAVRPNFSLEKFRANGTISIKDLLTVAPLELKDHSLMITNKSVVEDPTKTWNVCNKTGNIDGPWTFKTLMKHLASTNPGSLATDIQISDFVEDWLNNWVTTQNINGEIVPSRSQMTNIMATWKTQSQSLPAPRVPVGKLDMRAAPFKLTAIVNRLDLRGNSGYGFSNAGEGRFVFCLLNGCSPIQFNIILEYGIPKKSCPDLKAFAQQWYDLKNFAFTDPEFRNRLQIITDQFTKCGTSPSKANQSSLNQLRSNEIALTGPWELREFGIDNTTHLLKEVTVKQEPAVKYNRKINNTDVQRLVKFIRDNEIAVLANKHTVPDQFENTSFLGGHSLTQFPPVGSPVTVPHHWNGTIAAGPAFIANSDARQSFSLQTCSGCHGGETQTSFTMVDPVSFGSEATLAGFLTGQPGNPVGGRTPVDLDGPNNIMFVPDPAGRTSSDGRRKFNDLQRRADDLEALVNSTCKSIFQIRDLLTRDPIRSTH